MDSLQRRRMLPDFLVKKTLKQDTSFQQLQLELELPLPDIIEEAKDMEETDGYIIMDVF